MSVTLDTPDAATNINGVVHVVGQHNGQAARQLIDIATGTVGQVEFFDSLLSAGGQSGNPAGKIFGVNQLANGDVIYVGWSAGLIDTVQPTYWFGPDAPEGGVGGAGVADSGEIYAVSQGGVFVGSDDVALYGSPGGIPQNLPGFNPVVAVDISDNSQFIVGDYIWKQDAVGAYDVLDTSGFDFAIVGQLPAWKAVAIDPVVGDAVFAGSYFDLATFSESVGFWRADGTFLGHSGANTYFRDFEIWEGQLVAGVADNDDSYLFAISDFSWVALEEILGVKSVIYDDGLFVGSAGFLSSGTNGAFLTTRTTHDQNGNGGGTEVPEPSSLLLISAGFALTRRMRRR